MDSLTNVAQVSWYWKEGDTIPNDAVVVSEENSMEVWAPIIQKAKDLGICQ